MSNRIKVDSPAPDFSLADINGNLFRLADYRGRKHIVLVFNRGFV
jgi:peroxiredoxin